MKIVHRIPVGRLSLTDPVTPEYQAEVDATMARAAKRERDAQRRLDAAVRKLVAVERRHGTRARVHAVLVAREIVEIRRQELLMLQRAMQSSPAASDHRSRETKRPIPQGTTL